MSIFQEAFSEADTPRDSGPVPEGEYDVILLDVTRTQHPTTDVFTTNLEYEITSGPHAKRHVWDNIQNKDEHMWKVAKIWNALGMKEMPDDWDDFTLRVRQTRIGRNYIIRIANRESNGKTYTNVVSVRAGSDEPPF